MIPPERCESHAAFDMITMGRSMEGFIQCPGCTRKLARRFATCPYCKTVVPGGGVPSTPDAPDAGGVAGAEPDAPPLPAVAEVAGTASGEAMGVSAPLTLLERAVVLALLAALAFAVLGIYFWASRVPIGDSPGKIALGVGFALGLALNGVFFVALRRRIASVSSPDPSTRIVQAFGAAVVLFVVGYVGGALSVFGLLHTANSVTLEERESDCVVVKSWAKRSKRGGSYREMSYRCDDPPAEGTTSLIFEEGNKEGTARRFTIDVHRGPLGYWYAKGSMGELVVKTWEYRGLYDDRR